MWTPEEIESTGILYRQISAFRRTSAEGVKYKFPGPEHFSIRPDKEDSLSFNWDKYATIEQLFTLLGLRKGGDGNYITPDNYVMYQYPVAIFKDITGFEKLIHDPENFGNPSEEGKPNNPSHTLLYCGEFKIGTRAQLSKYCMTAESSKVEFKIKTIRSAIEELRKRKNDTPYHKDWNFSEESIENLANEDKEIVEEKKTNI